MQEEIKVEELSCKHIIEAYYFPIRKAKNWNNMNFPTELI